MRQLKIPAAFMRGGTSNAIVFRQEDLPEDRELWSEIFIAAIGSPDPYGRQLNGMGGGISSLSKVCVRRDTDPARCRYRLHLCTSCGARSEGRIWWQLRQYVGGHVGPFAVDEGMVRAQGEQAVIRIHNTNTSKIIEAHFDIDDHQAAVDGDYELPGVGGTGSALRLDFWNQVAQLPANCCRPVIRSISWRLRA